MSDISSADTRRGNLSLDLGGEPPTETPYSTRTPVRYVFIHKGGTEIDGSLAPKRGLHWTSRLTSTAAVMAVWFPFTQPPR